MKMMTRRLLCWPGTAERQFERLDPRSGRAHSEEDDETLVVMTERVRRSISRKLTDLLDTVQWQLLEDNLRTITRRCGDLILRALDCKDYFIYLETFEFKTCFKIKKQRKW